MQTLYRKDKAIGNTEPVRNRYRRGTRGEGDDYITQRLCRVPMSGQRLAAMVRIMRPVRCFMLLLMQSATACARYGWEKHEAPKMGLNGISKL